MNGVMDATKRLDAGGTGRCKKVLQKQGLRTIAIRNDA